MTDPKKTNIIPSNDLLTKIAEALVETMKAETFPGHPLHDFLAATNPENAAKTDPLWRILAMRAASLVLADAPAPPAPSPSVSEMAKTDPPPKQDKPQSNFAKGTVVAYWTAIDRWLPAIITDNEVMTVGGRSMIYYSVTVFDQHGITFRQAVPEFHPPPGQFHAPNSVTSVPTELERTIKNPRRTIPRGPVAGIVSPRAVPVTTGRVAPLPRQRQTNAAGVTPR